MGCSQSSCNGRDSSKELVSKISTRQILHGMLKRKKKPHWSSTEWDVDVFSVNSEHRKRRLSDQAMDHVMHDERIFNAMIDYSKEEEVEFIPVAWSDLDAFDAVPLDHPEYVSKANDIFKKHFSNELCVRFWSIIPVDSWKEIREDLKIKEESGDIGQLDPAVVSDVFKVLHLRLHCCIKYEHLPSFLLSDEFREVSDKAQVKTEEGDVLLLEGSDSEDSLCGSGKSLGRASSSDFVQEFVNNSEKAAYFLEYILREATGVRGSVDGAGKHHRRRSFNLHRQVGLVELYNEIQALLDDSADEASKLKRLNRIMLRYAPPSQEFISPPVNSLTIVYQEMDFGDDEKGLETLPENLPELFQKINYEILSRIATDIFPEFKRSVSYKRMQENSRKHMDLPEVEEDAVANQGTVLRTYDTQSRVASLELFANDLTTAGVSFTARHGKSAVSLSHVLSDTLGVLLLKRYAIQMFQEENILFLVDVINYKTFVTETEEHEMYGLLHRAQTMVRQYVEPGSPMEINISFDQRNDIINSVSDVFSKFIAALTSSTSSPKRNASVPNSVLLHFFSDAYDEIYTLVTKGLWNTFKSTALFKEYIGKQRVRNSRYHKIANEPNS